MKLHAYISILLFLTATLFLYGGDAGASASQAPESVSHSSEVISCLKDLDTPSRKLGVMQGLISETETKKALPNATYVVYNAPADCYVALKMGKIDGVAYDRPALEAAAMAEPEYAVCVEDVAIGHVCVGLSRKNKELGKRVNEFIRHSRQTGLYQEMYDRWVNEAHPVMPEIPKAKSPSKTLRIGLDVANPPMCYLENGEPTGFDVEFSKQLALYLGMEVEFVLLPYDGMVSALEGRKIDLSVAQMDATSEREESIIFSEEYIDSPVAIMVRKADYAGPEFMRFSELEDRNIGTLTGSAFDALGTDFLPKHNVLNFNLYSDLSTALEGKKIDAFYIDKPAGRFLLLQRPNLTVMPQSIPCGDYASLFSKKDPELCEKFTEEIRKMKADGTLKRLQDKWFSLDDSKKNLEEGLEGGKILRYGISVDSEPFGYVKDSKPVGYELDVMIVAAKNLGYTLDVQVIATASLVEAVVSGKCDFGGGCIIITPERQESVLFSEPIYDGGIDLIVRRSQASSAGAGSLGERLKAMLRSIASSFDKTFIRESRWKLILQGLGTTLVITVCAVLLGTILAFPLCGMCRSRKRVLSWVGERFNSLVSGTPILVILMILYYVIFAKVDIAGTVVAILALSLDFASGTSVALRSGIDGIPKGQTEAALALGHTPPAAFFRFILPQAIRTVLPIYGGNIISTLKSTSVVGYIAIMDLTKMGDIIRSRTYEAFFPLIAIAAIYFLAAKGLTAILRLLEKRLDFENHRKRAMKGGAK